MEIYLIISSVVLLIINTVLIIMLIISGKKKSEGPDAAAAAEEAKKEILDELDATADDLEKDMRDYISLQINQVRSDFGQKQSELKQELMTSEGAMKQELMASQASLKQELLNSQQLLKQEVKASQTSLKQELTASQEKFGNQMTEAQKADRESMNELLATKLSHLDETSKKQTESMEKGISALRESTEKNLIEIRENNDRSLNRIREDNDKKLTELSDRTDKKLDEIKGTVDEKLTETLNKRISESFKSVSDQLEQVYKGLGEMKNLAGDVGGLKAVLSGVKTRGILGEFQLGAILEEILSPEQYDTNIATVPGSTERVEYAIKLPGSDGSHVYLPIDAKFPGDTYQTLLDAYDSADKAVIDAAKKQLVTRFKAEAKDIKDKYVEVPYTTNFGIMFLPFEGLYSEAVNLGMVELLQKDYQVNIAGPSTMGAMLSSLQMGFKTLAIQKRSNEVWNVLASVKTEFGKFGDVLISMQKHLDMTSNDLQKLMTTRTNAINRKLRDVQALEDKTDVYSEELSGIESIEEGE